VTEHWIVKQLSEKDWVTARIAKLKAAHGLGLVVKYNLRWVFPAGYVYLDAAKS